MTFSLCPMLPLRIFSGKCSTRTLCRFLMWSCILAEDVPRHNWVWGGGQSKEDALMAVSTLVEVLGGETMKYLYAFKPFLGIGLKNDAEYHVFLAVVCLVGDLP